MPDTSLRFNVLQQELAAIFKKIGDKQTCTIGLYELYRITQLYPQVIRASLRQSLDRRFWSNLLGKEKITRKFSYILFVFSLPSKIPPQTHDSNTT